MATDKKKSSCPLVSEEILSTNPYSLLHSTSFKPSMPLNLPTPAPTRSYFGTQMSRNLSTNSSTTSNNNITHNHNTNINNSSDNNFSNHLLPPIVPYSQQQQTKTSISSIPKTLASEAQSLLFALLQGQVDLSTRQVTDRFNTLDKPIVSKEQQEYTALSNNTMISGHWDQLILDFIRNPNYRSAFKCLVQEIKLKNTSSFKLSKSHLIYNFYLTLKSLGVSLKPFTQSTLVWYLSYHGNWFEVLHVLSDLPVDEWDFDLYKLSVRAHLRKRPKDIKSAEMVLARVLSLDTITDAQKTQLKLFFEANVKAESWEDCKNQYEAAKLKALNLESAHVNNHYTHTNSSYYSTSTMTATPSYNNNSSNYNNQNNKNRDSTSSNTSFSPRSSFSSPFPNGNMVSCTQSQTQTKLLELGNAVMDICLTYDEYEYGWGVYEELPYIDKHTLRIVMNICKNATRKLSFMEAQADSIMESMKWEGRAWTLYMRAKQSTIPDALSFVLPQMIGILTTATQVTSPGSKVLRLYQEFIEYRQKQVVNRSHLTMVNIEEKFLRGLAQIYLSGHFDDIVLAACWQIYEAIKFKMASSNSYVYMLQIAARMETMESFRQLCEEITQIRPDASLILEKAKVILKSTPAEEDKLLEHQESYVTGYLADTLAETHLSCNVSARSSMDNSVTSDRLDRKISAQSSYSNPCSELSMDSVEFIGDQGIHLPENLVTLTKDEAILVLGSWTMKVLEL